MKKIKNSLGSGAAEAVNLSTPRTNFSVQFAHIHAVIDTAPRLNSTAIAVDVDERIRRMHEARKDELRRRGLPGRIII